MHTTCSTNDLIHARCIFALNLILIKANIQTLKTTLTKKQTFGGSSEAAYKLLLA